MTNELLSILSFYNVLQLPKYQYIVYFNLLEIYCTCSSTLLHTFNQNIWIDDTLWTQVTVTFSNGAQCSKNQPETAWPASWKAIFFFSWGKKIFVFFSKPYQNNMYFIMYCM